MEDAPAREEGLASVTAANSITNNTVSSNSAIANSDPSSPPGDQNLSSMRNSPRNISDDDTATAGRPVHRTLPGSFLLVNNECYSVFVLLFNSCLSLLFNIQTTL